MASLKRCHTSIALKSSTLLERLKCLLCLMDDRLITYRASERFKNTIPSSMYISFNILVSSLPFIRELEIVLSRIRYFSNIAERRVTPRFGLKPRHRNELIVRVPSSNRIIISTSITSRAFSSDFATVYNGFEKSSNTPRSTVDNRCSASNFLRVHLPIR